MPRLSKDTEFNRFGLSFIELCCTYSIHVFNGRLFDDIPGKYTCLANKGASVVDYMASSTSLFKYVTYFKIDDNDETVHFPITCHFSFPTKPNLNDPVVDSIENMLPWFKYKWKPELKDIFVDKLTSEFQQFNETRNSLENRTSSSFLPDFINIFKISAENMKCKRIINASAQPPWFDNQCKILKREKTRFLRQFRVSNDRYDLLKYKTSKNKFKSLCKNKKYLHCKAKRKMLVDSRKNAIQFWNIFKKGNKTENVGSLISCNH